MQGLPCGIKTQQKHLQSSREYELTFNDFGSLTFACSIFSFKGTLQSLQDPHFTPLCNWTLWRNMSHRGHIFSC